MKKLDAALLDQTSVECRRRLHLAEAVSEDYVMNVLLLLDSMIDCQSLSEIVKFEAMGMTRRMKAATSMPAAFGQPAATGGRSLCGIDPGVVFEVEGLRLGPRPPRSNKKESLTHKRFEG